MIELQDSTMKDILAEKLHELEVLNERSNMDALTQLIKLQELEKRLQELEKKSKKETKEKKK